MIERIGHHDFFEDAAQGVVESRPLWCFRCEMFVRLFYGIVHIGDDSITNVCLVLALRLVSGPLSALCSSCVQLP